MFYQAGCLAARRICYTRVMATEEESHARELLGRSSAYAKRAVELLLADERLKGRVAPTLKSAIEVEIGRFHLFLIFSALQDKDHQAKTFFQRVHDSLREQFLALEARRLKGLRDELTGVENGDQIWKGLEAEKDPLEPYYGSFDGGCKTIEDSPFGVVARLVSSRFFPEESVSVAYETVLSITLDSGDRVTREIDEIRNAGET